MAIKAKIFAGALLISALTVSSCSSVKLTSTTAPVVTEVSSVANADLIVSQTKISYTYYPTSQVKRGGKKNVMATAVAEALRANGNADVLVACQYEIKESRNFFGHKSIKYVKVTGYPATYRNIKPANH